MSQSQFGGSVGGPLLKNRTFYFSNVEQRHLDQSGLVTIPEPAVAVNQRPAGGRRLSRTARRHWRLPDPRALDQRARQSRPPGRRARSVQRALQPLPPRLEQLAQRRGLDRAERRDRRRQLRSDLRAQQHADAVVAHRARDPRAARGQRFHGAARRPGRSGGEHCRHRGVRNELGQSRGAAQHALPGRQQPLAPERQPCAEARHRFHLQRRSDHLSPRLPRQLRVLVAGEFSGRRLQQRGLHADLRRIRRLADQSQPRAARPGRVEGDLAHHAERRRPLRPAVAGDHRDRRQQPVAARRRGVVALRCPPHDRSRQCRHLLRPRAAPRRGQRPAVGRQHDRRIAAAPDRHQPVARTGLCAGLPRDPHEQRTVRHAAKSDDDGPAAAERLLAPGKRRGRAADRRARHRQRRVSLRPRRTAADVHQPERAGLCRVGHQQRLPAQSRLREQQPVLVGRHCRPITVSTCRSCIGRRVGASTACRTPCRRR